MSANVRKFVSPQKSTRHDLPHSSDVDVQPDMTSIARGTCEGEYSRSRSRVSLKNKSRLLPSQYKLAQH